MTLNLEGEAKQKKKVNRKEDRQIKFRVSDDEFERLEQLAKPFKLSVPAFCKMKSQGSKLLLKNSNERTANDIANELRAIGNNVNQLARKANQGNIVNDDELELVRKELRDIWQLFNDQLQKKQTD